MKSHTVIRREIAVPAAEARAMQALLDAPKPQQNYGEEDEYEKIYEVDCGDGYTAHVNVFHEEDGPIVDAALFYQRTPRSRSNEVASLGNDHRYKLLGDYEFDHRGRHFVISVVEAPENPPTQQRRQSARGRKRAR